MDQDREPLTPMARLCLGAEHNQMIHCVIGLENPVDIDALKHQISNSIILKVPRFSSLPVLDPFDGAETWRETQVKIDDHVFIHEKLDNNNDDGHHTHTSSKDDIINSFLGEIAISQPMRLDKPLWELHVLQDQKCLVMRVHHALGDGVSMMSMLWSMGRSRGVMDVDDQVQEFKKQLNANSTKKSSKRMGLWGVLMFIWYSLVFGFKILMKCFIKDKLKVISGIDGVELWPRKIATARFRLADMKAIKKAVPNATVNDILYGIVWCGLTRYLNARYPQAAQNGAKFNGLCPVNLREQPGLQDILSSTVSWGNKFSVILLPMNHYNKQSELEPLEYVARAKSVMDKKKQSMEARLSYNLVKHASKFFGPKMGGLLFYKLFKHVSFFLSNIPGPSEKITIANNPVTFIRVTSSTMPHAITMHMVSYLEWADLQIQVAKDLIPDPKFLAKCFEDILDEMKKATNAVIAN